MTLWIMPTIVLVAILCYISQAQADARDGTKVRCEASAVHMGGEGHVTCHYPVDLNQIHCIVDIRQFVDKSDTHILSCDCSSVHNCSDVKQGYRITNFTAHTLKVTIPKVTDEHRGRYRCSLTDEKPHGYELCDFEVKDEAKVRCEASAVHMGGEGHVTCHYPVDLNQINCTVGIRQFVNNSGTHILNCDCSSVHRCEDVRQGYRITNFTAHTLTVTIPKVTDEHRGRYRCSLDDEKKAYDYELCDFEVNDKYETKSDAKIVTILVIVAIIAIVVSVAVLYCCRRKLINCARTTCPCNGNPSTNSSNSPGNSPPAEQQSPSSGNIRMTENAPSQDVASDAEGTENNTTPFLSLEESGAHQDPDKKKEEMEEASI